MSRAERAEVEAADWIIAQSDGPLSEAEQAKFDAWFEASDGNKSAYWRLEYSWEEADRIGSLGRDSIGETEPSRYSASKRLWIPTSIAASLALLAGSVAYLRQQPATEIAAPSEMAATTYRTKIGNSREIDLSDGSKVQLNTASVVRTAVTSQAREVWLDSGEAFFEVAHKDGQPFIVHAGDRRITVLGTKFSVRREGAKVIVTVLEGRVRVEDVGANRPARSTEIVGGDIALAEGTNTMVTARSEEKVESALAWRTGMLSFDREPLSAICAEFNRYNSKKLVVAGSVPDSLRIGGVFTATDPDAFARLLRDAYGLKVTETAGEIHISS